MPDGPVQGPTVLMPNKGLKQHLFSIELPGLTILSAAIRDVKRLFTHRELSKG